MTHRILENVSVTGDVDATGQLRARTTGVVFPDDSTQTTARGANPMTTQDDLILAGSSGAETRLPKGSNGYALMIDPTTGHVVWRNVFGPAPAPYVLENDLVFDTGIVLTAGTTEISDEGVRHQSDGTETPTHEDFLDQSRVLLGRIYSFDDELGVKRLTLASYQAGAVKAYIMIDSAAKMLLGADDDILLIQRGVSKQVEVQLNTGSHFKVSDASLDTRLDMNDEGVTQIVSVDPDSPALELRIPSDQAEVAFNIYKVAVGPVFQVGPDGNVQAEYVASNQGYAFGDGSVQEKAAGRLASAAKFGWRR
jgi:hypothetical protein